MRADRPTFALRRAHEREYRHRGNECPRNRRPRAAPLHGSVDGPGNLPRRQRSEEPQRADMQRGRDATARRALVTLAQKVKHYKRARPGKPPAVSQGMVNLNNGEKCIEHHRRQQPQRRQPSNAETRSPAQLTARERSHGEEYEARTRIIAVRDTTLDFGESTERPPQQPPEKQHRRDGLFVPRQALSIFPQDGRAEYRGGADQHTAETCAVEHRQCLLHLVAVGPEDHASRDLQQRTERTRQPPALAASDPHEPGALHRPGDRAPSTVEPQRHR